MLLGKCRLSGEVADDYGGEEGKAISLTIQAFVVIHSRALGKKASARQPNASKISADSPKRRSVRPMNGVPCHQGSEGAPGRNQPPPR
jgi:hypothetical protein